jgi:hypothetical protein
VVSPLPPLALPFLWHEIRFPLASEYLLYVFLWQVEGKLLCFSLQLVYYVVLPCTKEETKKTKKKTE